MSYEAYNTFADAVKTEMQRLNYEQQLGILTIVVSAMNQKTRKANSMSQEETLALFKELSGCINSDKEIDAKQEYLEYLDERYGAIV